MDEKLSSIPTIRNEFEKDIFNDIMYSVEEYTLENLVPDEINKVVKHESGRIRWTYTQAPNDMHLLEFKESDIKNPCVRFVVYIEHDGSV